MIDYKFLKDVEEAAEFLTDMPFEPRIKRLAERLKCDVFDELKPYRVKEKRVVTKRRRAAVRLRAYAEAR